MSGFDMAESLGAPYVPPVELEHFKQPMRR